MKTEGRVITIEQFIESWWLYIIFVVWGFTFRVVLYNPFETNSAMSRKNTFIQIGLIVIITLWMGGNHNSELSKNLGADLLLFMGYCLYALIKKTDHKDILKASL